MSEHRCIRYNRKRLHSCNEELFMSNNPVVSIVLIIVVVGAALVAANVFFPGPLAEGPEQSSLALEPGSLLLFTQDGCPPCRQLEAVLHSDDVSAFLKKSGVNITEVDTRKHQDLVRQFHVHATPTLVLLDEKARARATKMGSMDATSFMTWVKTNR